VAEGGQRVAGSWLSRLNGARCAEQNSRLARERKTQLEPYPSLLPRSPPPFTPTRPNSHHVLRQIRTARGLEGHQALLEWRPIRVRELVKRERCVCVFLPAVRLDLLSAHAPLSPPPLFSASATCIIQPIDMVKVRLQLGATGGPVSANGKRGERRGWWLRRISFAARAERTLAVLPLPARLPPFLRPALPGHALGRVMQCHAYAWGVLWHRCTPLVGRRWHLHPPLKRPAARRRSERPVLRSLGMAAFRRGRDQARPGHP